MINFLIMLQIQICVEFKGNAVELATRAFCIKVIYKLTSFLYKCYIQLYAQNDLVHVYCSQF